MSLSLMSAIDCRPQECANLFIRNISGADRGRIRWKFILIAQTCRSTARIVLVANSGRPRLFAGGSSASTTGLFFTAAAMEILSRNGLVIGLYQRVVRCKPYHLEVNEAVFVEPCRERWLLIPLARIAQ